MEEGDYIIQAGNSDTGAVIVTVHDGRVRLTGWDAADDAALVAEAERVLASEEPEDEALVMERGEMTGGVTE